MRRANVEIRIPAQIDRALRGAVGRAEDRNIGMESLRRGAALCVLIVICAALLGSRFLRRLIHGRRAIVVLGLALAIAVVALEYPSPKKRTTNAVSFAPAPARAPENEPAGQSMNQSAEENARMAQWKSSIEQALAEAEARKQDRQQDAATTEDGVNATEARNRTAQQSEATRIDLGIARENAQKQAHALSAGNEDKAATGTIPASGPSGAEDANAANDAKRAKETIGSERFSDISPTAGGQTQQTGSTSRSNGSQRAEIDRATKETDDPEVARKNGIARHAMTYSWVTTDGAGHQWVHTRPIYYSQKD
jgi:hypothetical protein